MAQCAPVKTHSAWLSMAYATLEVQQRGQKLCVLLPSGHLYHLNGHSHLYGCDTNYVVVQPHRQNTHTHCLYFDWQLPGSFSVRMGHLTWMSDVIYVQQNSMTSEIKNTSVVVVVLWILVVSGFSCPGSAELLPYSGSIFCPFRADSVDSDFFFFLNQKMKSLCFLCFVTQRHPTHLWSSFSPLSCPW